MSKKSWKRKCLLVDQRSANRSILHSFSFLLFILLPQSSTNTDNYIKSCIVSCIYEQRRIRYETANGAPSSVSILTKSRKRLNGFILYKNIRKNTRFLSKICYLYISIGHLNNDRSSINNVTYKARSRCYELHDRIHYYHYYHYQFPRSLILLSSNQTRYRDFDRCRRARDRSGEKCD